MANSDKNLTIRPRINEIANPVIEFVGADAGTGPQTITAEVTPTAQGTITFAGTSGTILTLADNATYKLDVNGATRIAGDLTVTGGTTISGSTTFDTDIIPNTDNTGNVGTVALTWNNGRFTNFTVDSTLTTANLNIGADTIAEYIADTVGAMVTSNTESGISVTYQDADNTLDFDVGDFSITLTGAVTGSGTVTNLGNVSIATTHTADPTLTLDGDVSGSATFTNLGNATLTVTIADDSHNHIISNVDGLQTALDDKLDLAGGTMTGFLTISHAGDEILRLQDNSATGSPFITLHQSTTQRAQIGYRDTGDYIYLYNSSNGEELRIGNGVSGLQWLGNGSVYTIFHTGNDGSGSGLDADTVDGTQLAAITHSGDSVALTGDVTGSTTVASDGTISIATTIAANSVALGTDTTGNYMVNVQGTTNEIEVTHTQGEGSTATIGLPNNVTVTGDLAINGGDLTTTATTFNLINTTATTVNFAGTASALTIGATTGTTTIRDDLSVSGNLQVDGDLTVSGTTVTIDATNLAVEDNMIYLNSGSTVTNPDLGWAGNYNNGTYAHAGFFRDATDGYFKPYQGYTLEPDASAFIDTAHASFSLADIQAANFRGALVGNASTATAWATGRTITLTGDVTGTSTAFDGSGNLSFATTIAANSVALGTDTTGNYMVNVQGTTNEIEVTHTQGEGSTATIGLPNNVTVTGNLTVDTDTLFVDATNNRVGIGTTTPSATVQVNVGSLGTTIGDRLDITRLGGTTTNADSLIHSLQRTANGTDWTTSRHTIQRRIDVTDMGYISFGSFNTDLITFGEGSTEYMRIDGSGDVSVTNNLTVGVSLNISGNIVHTGDTDTYFGFHALDQWRVVTAAGERFEVNTTNTTVQNNLIVNANTTLGNATTDTITFTGRQVSDLVPSTNNTRNLGSATLKYSTVHATLFNGTALEAYYADLAENYEADQLYEPGTVLVFGGPKELTTTNTANNFRIAGVVSTEPATLMNSKLEGDTVVPLALQGRVPCKVIGRVEKGDMIVSSAVPGYGMVNNQPTMGTVIGKAVGTKTDLDRGWVEVVVGRV